MASMKEPEQDAGETSAKEKDLREEHRKRVIKSATIILGPAKSETSCIIRNQNAGGAKLEVPADVIVPGKFLLYVPIDGWPIGLRSDGETRAGLEWGSQDGTEAAISLRITHGSGWTRNSIRCAISSPLQLFAASLLSCVARRN